MSELLRRIDARTKLVGANKLEVLLFALGQDSASGRKEIFGINVFKVREVMRIPEITRAPEMPPAVEGMISLRGALVPVVDLAKYIGISTSGPPGIMIVTEYNGQTQGFLVGEVDTILRVDWSSMRVPPSMLNARMGGLVTAVTELEDKRLVMMLDVEKILADTTGQDDSHLYEGLKPLGKSNKTVFFADDSSVARGQIEHTLKAMDVNFIGTINGREAWDELCKIADREETLGRPVSESIQVILTDVEMPEMDGYVLTRNIKADSRFKGIPVLMHSSLSSEANRQLGISVGVDEYVPKFEPHRLAEVLARLLN
jgi:two-component system, chemotaxis family, chemotaxis protein CheV